MARVIGLFKLRGSIDDLTFRKTQDGIIAGMKPGPTRERVLTHKNFRVTRCNADEFQQAIKDARLLRHALGTALNGRTGSSMNGRVNGVFYKMARRDASNDLGFRRSIYGDIGLLTGFNFNKQLSLADALSVPFTHALSADTGTCRVEVPPFIARKRKGFPPGATHFRLVSGMVVIDFLNGKYKQDIQLGELLPLRKKTPGAIGFEHTIERMNGQVVVQVLGIEFYELVDEYPVLVKGSALEVLEVVKTVQSREFGVLSPEFKVDNEGIEEKPGVEGTGIGAIRERDCELVESPIGGVSYELRQPVVHEDAKLGEIEGELKELGVLMVQDDTTVAHLPEEVHPCVVQYEGAGP